MEQINKFHLSLYQADGRLFLSWPPMCIQWVARNLDSGGKFTVAHYEFMAGTVTIALFTNYTFFKKNTHTLINSHLTFSTHTLSV